MAWWVNKSSKFNDPPGSFLSVEVYVCTWMDGSIDVLTPYANMMITYYAGGSESTSLANLVTHQSPALALNEFKDEQTLCMKITTHSARARWVNKLVTHQS